MLSSRSRPFTSLRGIMMSSTVTFSRSRIALSMPWLSPESLCPEISTRDLSSSLSSASSRSFLGSKPSREISALVRLLTAHTSGVSSCSMGFKIWLALKANHSGFCAAMVFGVTSEKTSTAMVNEAVATQGAAASPT